MPKTLIWGFAPLKCHTVPSIIPKATPKPVDITNVEDMNREIQEASRERFTLACQAPIQRSSINDRAGTCGETNYARQLLTREVDIPQDTNKATNSIIEEMADLWENMCSATKVTGGE
jgi:hypothetical protein